jgi:VRR-NUC domain
VSPPADRHRSLRDLFGRAIQPAGDRNAEGRIPIAVQWLRWAAPQIVVFHPANGGWRTKAESARFKAMGVLAGTPDLVLILPESRCAFFWEMRTPQGALSDVQKDFVARLEAAGHAWAVIHGIDDARAELDRLGVSFDTQGGGA